MLYFGKGRIGFMGIAVMSTTNSLRDPLTGAYTRAALYDRLREEIARALRYDLPLALMIIDLDHFKSINDAFGHARGDQTLMAVATRLRDRLRTSDLLFRYGGDEFVTLLPSTNIQAAAHLGQRLLDAVRETLFEGEPPLSLTLTIGVADLSEGIPTPEDLFERADQRLFAAKRAGRARVLAETQAPVQELLFEASGRLLDRDAEIEISRQFLDRLQHDRRGTLVISGPPGSGRTRMLHEIGKLANLRGYAVWHIAAAPGLRLRAFGCFDASVQPWQHWLNPQMDAEQFAQAIAQRLTDKNQIGVIFAIDRVTDLDQSSIALLRALCYSQSMPPFALIYTHDSDHSDGLPYLDVVLRATIHLSPLQQASTHLWLRSVLRWEPPANLVQHLYEVTQGLPRLMVQALTYLVNHAVLNRQPTGWAVQPSIDIALLSFQPSQTPPHNLPTFLPELIGRQAQLAQFYELFRHHHMVELVAPGGMGKSRFALQVGWELLEQFPDGVFWVDLAVIERSDFIMQAIATAFGSQLVSNDLLEQHVLHLLQSRQLLLILDNAEHLRHAEGIFDTIRSRLGRSKLLLTTRERLGLADVATFELGGLTIPHNIIGSDLLLLFLQRVRRVDPEYTISLEELVYVRQIGEQVGGMPLGIELAAAWAPIFGCQQIVEQIDRSLDVLVSAEAGLPERQRGLRAVFDSFWQTLMADEQQTMGRLSVFRGGFDWPAARQVAGAGEFFLTALVAKSFLTQVDHGRFRLHELLRQYAEARLREQERSYQEVRQQHATFYADLAEHAAIHSRTAEQLRWLKRIDRERDNLRSALAWSVLMLPAQALRICVALCDYWDLRGSYREGLRWAEDLLTHAAPAFPYRWRAMVVAGVMRERCGDYSQAEQHLRQALVLAEQHADLYGRTIALAELRWLLYRRGQNNEARLYTHQTWQLAVQIHDEYQRIRSLRLIGALRYNQGYLSGGIRANQVALLRARRLGHPESIANSLNNLAVAYIRLQRYSEVIQLLGESLQIFEQLGQRQRVALTLSNLAMSAYYQGDYPAAQMYVVRSMSTYHDIGERVLLSYTEVGAGLISMAIGDLSRAEGFFHSGLQHARMAGLNPAILRALCGLAELRRRTGDRALARTVVGFVQHHPDLNASVYELLDPLIEALRHEEDDLAMIEQNLALGRSSSFEQIIEWLHLHTTSESERRSAA